MTTTFEALMSVGTAAVPMVEEPPRPPMNSSPSIETGPVVAQPVRALSPLPPAESWGKPMAPASARVPEPHRPAYHYEVRAPKCDAKNKELEKQILMLKDEVRRLEDEKIRGTREIQALRNDAHSQREIIEELRQLLDLKTSELQSTSALLPGADSAAIADIIRLVESLNEDIFQTAAFMSDALEPIPRMAKERIQGEASRVREEGFHINLEDSQDPLQYIFQNCLIQNCQRTLDMWTASEMQSQNLRNLYEIVKGEEKPSMALRWRSVTRQAAKQKWPQQAMSPGRLTRLMVGDIVSMLSTYGWEYSSYADLHATLSERVGRIARLCLELDKTIDMGITSRELHPYVPSAGQDFLPHIMSLETVESHRKKPRKGRVLLTCGMGLMGREVQGVGFKDVGYLKAKVMLDTAL